MKFVLRINDTEGTSEDEGPQSSTEESTGAESPVPICGPELHALEPVLERELMELCPDALRHDLTELSVSFVSRGEIRALNKEYRGLDEATDVLSFPLWEEDGRLALPEPRTTGPVLSLGDIVICPDETGRLHPELSEADALCLMLAHGFLHLLAWDHDTEERERAMWERQDALRERLVKSLGAR